MGKCKSLYQGSFAFPHKSYILRRAAYSADQAKILMAREIAKRQDTDNATVLKWLKDNEDKYLISLEVEWREEDGEN